MPEEEKHVSNSKRKSLSFFIFEHFASPIFLHLYKIECKVNDKLKNRNDIEESSRAMIYIHELTKNNAKNMLEVLLINYNICDSCILPTVLIREILEYGYDIKQELKLFDKDIDFEIPFLERIKIIPLLFDWIECIFNIILIICNWYEYYYYCNVFGSLQYILTLIHLILCHFSFFVNASLPSHLLQQWDSYYSIYKNENNRKQNENKNKLLRDRNKLLLLPYTKWTNMKKSLNVPQCLANDYIWVFAKCYNHCIYKLIMFHNICLCFTTISHKNIYFRQWYAFALYNIPILYIGIKAVFIKYVYLNHINFGRYLIATFAIAIACYYNDDNQPLPVIILNVIWKLFGLHFYNYLIFNYLAEQYRINHNSIRKMIFASIYPFLLFITQFSTRMSVPNDEVLPGVRSIWHW